MNKHAIYALEPIKNRFVENLETNVFFPSVYTVETQSPIKQDLMSNNSYRLYSDGDFEQGLSLFTVRAVVVKFWLRDGIRRKRKNALRNGRLNAARLRRDFAGFRFSPAAFSSARRQCFPRFLSLTAKARGPRGRWTETNSNVRTSALVCVHGLARPYPRCRADRRNAITYTIYVHATAKESRRGRFAWRRRIVRLPPITPPWTVPTHPSSRRSPPPPAF